MATLLSPSLTQSAMERLSRALCRTDHPLDDAAMLRRCAEAWPAALDAMRTAGDASPTDAARLFDGLCRWRAHRTWWTATGARRARRVATHYLVEAAARLALMDYVHSGEEAERRAREVRDVCAVSLTEAEHATLRQPFKAVRTEALPQLLLGVTSEWRSPASAERERASLAPAAHALLVSADTGASEVVARTDLLVRVARVSTLCAARDILRAIVARRAAADSPAVAEEAAVRAWALSRAAGVHSEAAAKGYSDAMAADRLDPSFLPLEEATASPSAVATAAQVSVLLTLQEPEAATRAADAAKGGAASLASRDGRDEAILTFALFDHAAHQLHGVRWAAAYTATDARPEAALARVRRYATERMVSPPPLLLLLDQHVYAVRRRTGGGEGVANVTMHATGASALGAWVKEAQAHAAVGPRHAAVIRAVLLGDAIADTEGLDVALPLVSA